MLAVGTQHQVDTQLREQGKDPVYVGGYRVLSLLFRNLSYKFFIPAIDCSGSTQVSVSCHSNVSAAIARQCNKPHAPKSERLDITRVASMIAQEMINMASKQSLDLLVHFVRGWTFKWEAEVCCLQVTTEAAMKVAMQAAGAARTTVESQLSKVGFTSLTAGLASLASARQPLSQRVKLLDTSIFLNITYNQKS